eukprot:5579699-Pyramimonas_sp.AAC.1
MFASSRKARSRPKRFKNPRAIWKLEKQVQEIHGAVENIQSGKLHTREISTKDAALHTRNNRGGCFVSPRFCGDTLMGTRIFKRPNRIEVPIVNASDNLLSCAPNDYQMP